METKESKPYLSIVIPAYNEAERIAKTLAAMDAQLAKADFTYEIVVVNDGSKDATAQIVKKLSEDIKGLRLIDNENNKGKGGVVRQGMLESLGQIRLFTDADNSTSIDHFFAMRPFFSQGFSVVIGSRAVKGAKLDPAQPWYRRIPGKIGNLIIQLFLLPGIKDTQCGFKAFSEEAVRKIFPVGYINGWGFDVEVLSLAKALGLHIKEIPVHWVNDLGSHVKASVYIKVLIETLKIRWWLWTNAYHLPKINV